MFKNTKPSGRRRLMLGMLGSAMLTCIGGTAFAQERPVFRVPLKAESTTATADSVWLWEQSVGSCSSVCGTGTRTVSYTCQDASQMDMTTGSLGAGEPETQCISHVGAKPVTAPQTCTNYTGCTFDWVKPAEQIQVFAGRPGCGDVERTYSPRCDRSDGTSLSKGDHQLCSSDTPDYNDVAAGVQGALGYDRRTSETSQCNASDHEWVVGGWGPTSSTCSTTAFKTRSVVCRRKFDGSTQPDAACGGGKPDTTMVEADYSTCSYSMGTPGGWGAWDSTCSATAHRTRTYTCLRSDGTTVPNSECTSRGVNLVEGDTQPQYGSCTHNWQVGGWSGPSSTCSTSAVKTRSVSCVRDLDGTVQADSLCNSGTRPAASMVEANYSTCSYTKGTAGSWGPWNSTCSANATRTRTYTCLRSDGTVVPDAECTGRGVGLIESESAPQYGSCSHNWQVGGWSAPSSTCSASAVKTRSVTCVRDLDGTVQPDPLCNTATRPAASMVEANYSTCSYGKGTPGAWSGWSSTCSASATHTRTYSCLRSDGTVVADSECTGRGINLSESETAPQYGGCSFAAGGSLTPVTAWSSTCSSSASRTLTYQCVRSDGTVVADAECTSRGVGLTRTETAPNYTGCSYSANPGPWSTCTAGTQTRPVTCIRSDGAAVDASNCGFPAGTTTQTQTCSSETYSWSTGAWGAWGTCTSGSHVRTRSVVCVSSSGATVADSNCSGSRPDSSAVEACVPTEYWRHELTALYADRQYDYGEAAVYENQCYAQGGAYTEIYEHSCVYHGDQYIQENWCIYDVVCYK